MIKNYMLFYIFHVKREKTYSSKWFGPACFYLEIVQKDPWKQMRNFPLHYLKSAEKQL